MLFHGCGTFANLGISVPAQIRQHKAIACRQSLRHRQPEFMAYGKRMQQDYRRALTERPVGDFGVAAFDALGRGALHARRLNHTCDSARAFRNAVSVDPKTERSRLKSRADYEVATV